MIKQNWDYTFKYRHNLILHNPLLDADGEYGYIDAIKGKRIRCFSAWQMKMVKIRGGIPVNFRKGGKMYYVEINGDQTGFTTEKTRDIMLKIRDAARKRKKVQILYKKKRGPVVKRIICPYALEEDYLWATDNKRFRKNEEAHAKTFHVEGIKSAKTLKLSFKPKWDIEL